jgi:hypothetical protein
MRRNKPTCVAAAHLVATGRRAVSEIAEALCDALVVGGGIQDRWSPSA